MKTDIKIQAKETWDVLCDLESKMFRIEAEHETKMDTMHNQFSALRTKLADIFNAKEEAPPITIENVETLEIIFSDERPLQITFLGLIESLTLT